MKFENAAAAAPGVSVDGVLTLGKEERQALAALIEAYADMEGWRMIACTRDEDPERARVYARHATTIRQNIRRLGVPLW